MSIIRRLSWAIFLLLFILTMGTLGYILIEKWSPLDALYMTVITISTVGFREIAPLSPVGKVFTICLIIGGIGTVIYTLGIIVEFLAEGHLTGLMERRKMRKQIEELRNHYILCGYGRVGRQVAKEFLKARVPFVVIENNPDTILKCREEGLLCLEGDASDDQILKAADVERAKGLVAVVDNDADNVFVTLSARVLNPGIFIVARAELEESEEKLKKAGADRVISPTAIGGRRMAALLLKPLVCDYLDVVAHGEKIEYQLEELGVKENSPIANVTIRETGIREKTGALILAIKKASGEFNTNPSASTVIEAGDKLVVMGTKDQLETLQDLI